MLAGGGAAQIIYSAAAGRQSTPYAGAVSPHYLVPRGHEYYDARFPGLLRGAAYPQQAGHEPSDHTEYTPGRYRFHDLLRIYAAEAAETDERDAGRAAALQRVLTWYLHTAEAASRRLEPAQRRIPLGVTPPHCQPLPFAAYHQALAWCDAEHENLVAAIGQAAATGHDDIGWQLPVTLTGFFGLRQRWADLQAATTIAVTCARRRGDQHGGLSLSSTTNSAMPTASASSASCSGSARPRAAAAGSWVAIRPFWHHPHRVARCPQHGGGDRIRSAAAGDAGSAGQRLQAGAVPGRTAGQPGRQHGLNRAVPQVTRPRGGRSEALSPLAQPSSPGVTIPATIRRSRIAGSRPRGGGRRCGLGWR